jgi:leader peptidase (prepilin peptidase)/N-methyltransferase
MALLLNLPTLLWCLWVLLFGLMVGSFINVLVARLPFEKSIVWPSSRCFACYTKIRLTDNLPILGYLRLRGKCRACGAAFSARYLWVEIGTGVAFLALFLVEVVFNRFNFPGVSIGGDGLPTASALGLFAYHAVLVAALVAAAAVDYEHRIIPAEITYTALAVGVLGSAFLPWPWPHPATAADAIPPGNPWILLNNVGKIPVGAQPWPFWGPLFESVPAGSWQLGLLNALLGALAGSLVVRAIKWLFETGLGREALGLGDADLLMMAGAFLGWQIAVLALFVGAFAALVLKVLQALVGGSDAPQSAPGGTPISGPAQPRELPFGPGLAIGVVVTWFAWPWLGPRVQFPFFDATVMAVLVGVMAVGVLAAALILRRPVEEPVATAAK